MTGTGIVLAAGGERLVAWYTGILAGLADAGVDPRAAAEVVGTSAGALVAAQLAAGVDPRPRADELARRRMTTDLRPAPSSAARLFAALAQLGAGPQRGRAIGRLAIDRSPGGEAALVERVRRRLPGGEWPRGLRIAALDAETGERVVFDRAAGVPLDRAVAAASSVPMLLPPVTIGSRTCIDGAVHSATNADVLSAAGLDRVVVITGSPADGDGLDALWNVVLERELDLLASTGVDTVLLRAGDQDRAAMGPDPMSRATAPLAVMAGRRRGRELAARLAAAPALAR
jgi:NTE family protein